MSGVNVGQVVPDNIPTNRKFVLIGDSFGCGIVDSTSPWVDGWIDYFATLFPGRVFYYDPATDTSYTGNSAFTTTSQKNFIGELNYTYNNKLNGTPPEQITDVVVLGGSNEVSGATVDTIYQAITTFCNRAKELFPNAQISIGIVGTMGQYFVYGSNIYTAYKQGAMRNGVRFLGDCINLGTDPNKKSSNGHWTSDGYGRNNLYIAEMIINGHVDYNIKFSIPIYGIADVTNPENFTFGLDCIMYKDHLVFELYVTFGYSCGYVKLNTKPNTTSSTRAGKMLRLNITDFDLVYQMGYEIFPCSYAYSRGTGYAAGPANDGSLRILKDGSYYYLAYQLGYPIQSSYITNANYFAELYWNKNSRYVPSFVETS